MPCDIFVMSDDEAACFIEILSEISSIREVSGINNCIICGDFNTDLGRHASVHTVSLAARFVEDENLHFCCNLEGFAIDYTFEIKINGITSCIDHFIIAANNMFEDGNNPSDHSMVYAMCNVNVQRSTVGNTSI